jgi:hypothetical protein
MSGNNAYGATGGPGNGQAIFTDDVSMQVFMEHLKRLVSVRFDIADNRRLERRHLRVELCDYVLYILFLPPCQ